MHRLGVTHLVSLDHPCWIRPPPRPCPCPSTMSNPGFRISSKAMAGSAKPATFLKLRPEAVSSNPCCSTSSKTEEEEEEEVEDKASDTKSGNSLVDDVGDGVFVGIEVVGRNMRRISSRVAIEADLHTVWSVLTDYERLVEFIPGLAVSRVIEKKGNFARIFQIGQQELSFGIKFSAKGTMDCYENDLEGLPHGQKRDIDFKMVEGDFQIFEGKWSIEQCNAGRGCEGSNSLTDQQFDTILTYFVDVKPKMWLPVRLVEGRLSEEIKLNLLCIREEAENAIHNTSLVDSTC